MIRASIQAGICGFATTVTARSEDQQPGHEGMVLKAARKHLKSCCSGCIVPGGLFKTVQVAGGVALPAVASVTIEKQE